MNRILSLMLIIAVSLFSVNAYAAFPAHPQNAQEQVVLTKSEIRQAMKTPAAPAPHNLSGTEVGLVVGILALVFGIVAVAASPVTALIFAAAAIVIGLMGLDKPWRGLSLAGLILGIIGGAVALVELIV